MEASKNNRSQQKENPSNMTPRVMALNIAGPADKTHEIHQKNYGMEQLIL